MLAKKINITNIISQNDFKTIKSYSALLSDAYNLCLDELRKNPDFKQIHQITKSFQNQNKILNSKHAQNVGRECINAVKGYFALKKKDKKAKFPKNHRTLSPITLDANIQKRNDKIYLGGGFKLDNSKIIFNYPKFNLDLSNCSFFNPDEININTIKQIVLKFEDKKLWCIFVYAEKKQEKIKSNKEFISIDLGISSIASIYSSNGECLKYKTRRFKGLEKQKNELKSKLAKKKKYSKRYNRIKEILNRKQCKLSNKRKDYLHKASRSIINYCLENKIDNIIIGDIKVKKLVGKYSRGLNKSTQNEGLLGRFKSFIKYKAELNGINCVLINESYTSQQNCLTGVIEFSSKLSNRIVELEKDLFVDRDLNSAVNIAKKYGPLWSGHSFNKYSLLNVNEIFV